MVLCSCCSDRPVASGRRKYCDVCGPLASARLKAHYRRDAAARWRAEGKAGQPPWLDYWSSHEARRAYYRDYMRQWRARRVIAGDRCAARLPAEETR